MSPHAKALLLDAVAQRWGVYKGELERVGTEHSEEAVHDLRVANRRMLSLLEFFQSLAEHRPVHKLHRELKIQLDGLDTLRDTQVMISRLDADVADFPELERLKGFLRKVERSQFRDCEKLIREFDLARVEKHVGRVSELVLESGDPARQLDRAILGVVDHLYQATLARYRVIDVEEIPTIHRLRISFKKFRYAAEIVHPMLDSYPVRLLEEMHDYQTTMGDIHDLEVLVSTLLDYAKKVRAFHPKPMLAEFDRLKMGQVDAFFQRKEKLTVFWRAGVRRRFPWKIANPV